MQEPVLEVKNVSKKSKSTRHGELQSLDFAIAPGEVFTLVGMDQWERRKTVDLVSALDQPDSGEIRFKGTNLRGPDELSLNALRGRMGFVTDPPAFLNNVRLMENLRLPLRYHSTWNTEKIDETISEILDDMNISGFNDLIPSNFSPFLLGAAALARALSTMPDILILERPEEYLDRSISGILSRLWKKYVLNHNGSILVFTGLPRLAIAVSDRIAIFSRNRITKIQDRDNYQSTLKKEDTQWK
ncbi:MAG: ATP-binding cassette domain-containing protein [Planctomycetota bacterium]